MAKSSKSVNPNKKALDKDMMFQKIMPALAQNPFTDFAAAQPASPAPASAESTIPAAPADDAVDTPPADETVQLAALSNRLFGRTTNHGFRPDDPFTINIMENVALKYLDEVMSKFNCCRCDHCRRDVAALALNSLPPKYMVVDARHIEEIVQAVPKQDIYDALVKAVLRVRMYPRH